MASLKEIRGRIISVSSTRKITSAMKMVSASKLKKAQNAIDNSIPYLSVLMGIVQNFKTAFQGECYSPFILKREVKKVTLIVVASNGSLCGAFNNNIIKKFNDVYADLAKTVGKKNISIYAVGRKIEEHLDKSHIKRKKLPIPIELSGSKLDYEPVVNLSNEFIDSFLKGHTDEVVFVYNHLKNTAIQEVYVKTLLPFTASEMETSDSEFIDYILEPGRYELVNELIPKIVNLQLFTGLLDSLAAEHGARTTAMQIATDNADELVQDLKLTYNKLRQTAITTEIITITGGAEAIR